VGWSRVRDNTASKQGSLITYPLLGQFTGTLVLAVSEKFDNTALIWCEAIQMSKVSHGPSILLLPPMSASVDVVSNYSMFAHDCNYHGDCGRLFRKKGVARIKFSTYPETSRTTSLTNSVRRLKCPFLLEIFVLGW
jgi:hypothetical protein